MNLRLKYYKVVVVIILLLCCLVLPALYASTLILSLNKELLWLILWGLLMLYVAIRLGYMVLFEFYQIRLTETNITLKNIITQRQTIIVERVTGFKINPVNGKLSLLDKDGDVIAILNAFHYFNVPEAIEFLGLKRKS